MTRRADVKRQTAETSILVSMDLDGTGKADIRTGIGFFDHMLHQIARHGQIDLTVMTVIFISTDTTPLKILESRWASVWPKH